MVSPELSLVGLSVDASHWLAQFLPPTGQALLLVDAKLKRRSFGNNSRRRSWLTGEGPRDCGRSETWILSKVRSWKWIIMSQAQLWSGKSKNQDPRGIKKQCVCGRWWHRTCCPLFSKALIHGFKLISPLKINHILVSVWSLTIKVFVATSELNTRPLVFRCSRDGNKGRPGSERPPRRRVHWKGWQRGQRQQGWPRSWSRQERVQRPKQTKEWTKLLPLGEWQALHKACKQRLLQVTFLHQNKVQSKSHSLMFNQKAPLSRFLSAASGFKPQLPRRSYDSRWTRQPNTSTSASTTRMSSRCENVFVECEEKHAWRNVYFRRFLFLFLIFSDGSDKEKEERKWG